MSRCCQREFAESFCDSRVFVISWRGELRQLIRTVTSCLRMKTLLIGRMPRFGLSPFLFELIERECPHRSPRLLDRVFHRFEPPRELVVRLTERGLGLDAELAREIGEGEQEIAHFLLH